MSTSSCSEDVGPLARVPAHLVRRVHQRHAKLWSQIVGEVPTPPQYAVLVVVADAPGIDLTMLGERAALDRTTVGRVVERLERDGWLRRVAAPTDRRRSVVELTPAGQRRMAATTRRASEAGRRLMGPLDAAETEHLLALLDRIANDE